MRLFTKIITVVISAALACSAFGCGSSGSSAQSADPGFEPQNIEVRDAGFSINEEGNLRYAFVAVNPNDGQVAQEVVFTVEAYDANGSMIAGGGGTLPVLYPGLETAGAGETELFSMDTDTPQVARLSIVPMMDSISWTPTKWTSEEIDAMVNIENPRIMASEDNLVIKAGIKIGFDSDRPENAPTNLDLRAVALLFDESGRAICGTGAFDLSVDLDNPYSFDATIEDAPEYADCNLYVTPAGII